VARVVVSPEARDGDAFVIEGEAYRHAVNVLRVARGDSFLVVDGSGHEFTCVAETLSSRSLRARVTQVRTLSPAPALSIHLCCGLLKGEKLDLVLQKGTELGVARFTFFAGQRSTVRIDPRDEVSRRGRWQRIVQGAVGQSGGGAYPDVDGPVSFDTVLTQAVQADLAILAWEGDGHTPLPRLAAVLRGHAALRTVAVLVGPEGGFSEGEIEAARAAGVTLVSLGARILRAETAAVVMPALLLAASGDLG